MHFQISSVLTGIEVSAVADAVANPDLWRDAKNTAQGNAKSVKENRRGDPSEPRRMDQKPNPIHGLSFAFV